MRSLGLLLGADPYAVRACIKNDITPVVLHSPQNYWGPIVNDWGHMTFPSGAEVIFVEDPTSIERVLFGLYRSGLADRELSFIQTTSEEALVTASALGSILGVPAIEPRVAVLFRDKWAQKKVVADAGVPTARSQVIEDIYEPDTSRFTDLDTAVLKPVAGGGTRYTSVVRGHQELVERCAEYRRQKIQPRTFVLEEFVAGDEWVVDGVVFDGEVQFMCVSAYSAPCLSVITAGQVMRVERFDPVADADVYETARPLVETSLRVLGLDRGVFHLEAFYQRDHDRLVFGECAARRGGGLTHEAVECKFGFDLGEAAVLCALGIKPSIQPSLRPGVVGSTFLATRPGVVVGYPSPTEILALPGVEHVRVELPYGFEISETVDTIDGVGQVVLSAGSRAEFRRRCDSLVQWFDERLLVVPPGASNQDLRKWQEAHWPASAAYFPVYSPS